ncbi:MAG: GTP-binding protein [Candidatus Hodarchaeota archaeon]
MQWASVKIAILSNFEEMAYLMLLRRIVTSINNERSVKWTYMYDLIFKVVIFGDAGSGKTSLRKRFMTNEFTSDSHKTIGVDYETKVLEMGGKEIKLLIGDLAGEERFRFMFPQYIYGAMGGILLYDITDNASFSHINDWLSVINGTNERFPIVLVGGKSDLYKFREISWINGAKAARSLGLYGFVECSSKTGENVKEVFLGLSKLMATRMLFNKPKIQSIRVK